jgi:hypothetical protein
MMKEADSVRRQAILQRKRKAFQSRPKDVRKLTLAVTASMMKDGRSFKQIIHFAGDNSEDGGEKNRSPAPRWHVLCKEEKGVVYLHRGGPTSESPQVNVYWGKQKQQVIWREEARLCHPSVLQTTKRSSIFITREKARVYEGFIFT